VTQGGAWMVDAHVHLHPLFPLAETFAAAESHFEGWARRLQLPAPATGCLLLAENEGETRFQQLRERDAGAIDGGWRVRPTEEEASLIVGRDRETRIVLIAGRQVVTTDRLEVLVLGTVEPVPDGITLEQAIDRAAAARALAIIPWGFGKWWGRRGARLASLVARHEERPFFLGDNGGRPDRFPRPPLLRTAAGHGIWDLPGSDPLPLPGEALRAGSYGFLLPIAPDLARPFTQIRDAVLGARSQPTLYGRRAGLAHFVRAQTALRRRRRN
jgi:hypothetical protein